MGGVTGAEMWLVHGVSVEGPRHKLLGKRCEDAWHAVTTPEVTVLAVADGAGSRSRAAEGAALAVELATEAFARFRLEPAPQGGSSLDRLRETFQRVRGEFLARTGDQADSYATTLTVVQIAPPVVGFATVGDGLAVVRAGTEDGERQYHLMPGPEAVSEYGNETIFLTSPDALHHLQVMVVHDPGLDGVIVSTDGLSQVAVSTRQPGWSLPNATFARAVFRPVDTLARQGGADADLGLAALLRSEALSRLNADDKTLVVAVRR